MQKIWIGKPSSPEVVTSAIARLSHTDHDKLFVITINANGDTSSSLLDIEMPLAR